MNDPTLEEVDRELRGAIAQWRFGQADPGEMQAALERIAAKPPILRKRRWAMVPAAAAAALVGLLLWWAPPALAEVVEVARAKAAEEATPGLEVAKAAWRWLLLIHVGFYTVSYFPYLIALLCLHLGVLLRLFGVVRVGRFAAKVAPWLAGIAGVFLLVGIMTGAFWAREVLGRYWAWHPKETAGVLTMVVSLLWLYAAWRFRLRPLLATAVTSSAFWLVLDLWLGYLAHGLGAIRLPSGAIVGEIPRVLLVCLLLDLMVLLGIGLWYHGEPPGDGVVTG